MVDSLLNFDIHVDNIKKRVQKRIEAMYRRSNLLPVNKYRKMFVVTDLLVLWVVQC